jgi:transcription elongation factor GreA
MRASETSRDIRGFEPFRERRSNAMSVASAVANHGSIPVTPAGHQRLRDDLHELATNQRAAVDARLRDARCHGGDLADNAELMYALEEHILLEQRIAKLESDLARARVITLGPDNGRVGIGSRVRLRRLDASDRRVEYEIVSLVEADIGRGKLSAESPLGAALLGRRAGDTVRVAAPAGAIDYAVLSVAPSGAQRPDRPRVASDAGPRVQVERDPDAVAA